MASQPLELGKTSVIIPCHNYGRYLSWCIESVLHQTRAAGEIIIIDDASDDDTQAIAASFGDRVRYFRVDFRNAQKSRNFGLEKATLDYILYVDADDFLDNDALRLMEDAMGADPQLRIVYGDRINFGNPQLIAQLKQGRHWCAQDFSLRDLHRFNFISMPSLLRRSTFAGFDERIRLNQDWDAWLGVLQTEKHAKRIPQPLFHYRFHGKNKTVQENGVTERFKIMVKHRLIDSLTHGKRNRRSLAELGGKTYVVIHSTAKFDVSILASASIELHSCKPNIYALRCSDERIQTNLQESGFVVTSAPELSAEAFLRSFLPIAAREVQDSDIFVMTDFSSAIDMQELAVLRQEAGAVSYTNGRTDQILQMRNFEDVGLIAMNGLALRHLLYIYERPYGFFRRLRFKSQDFLARHFFWRFYRRR